MPSSVNSEIYKLNPDCPWEIHFNHLYISICIHTYVTTEITKPQVV